jgi:hypothetical protein
LFIFIFFLFLFFLIFVKNTAKFITALGYT